MDELWEEALGQLREKLGKQNFETWIQPIRMRARDGTEITLEVPNKFFRDWLMEHFLTSIQETLSILSQQNVKLSVTVNQQLQKSRALEKKPEREKPKPSRVNNLIPKYNFENFVVGASNQFAHAASLAVANQPGDHYNPLFIYGGVGLGKTHLINAIGHRVVE
ncbi:MAG: DnaA/Hda family protein, partial [Candidatus Binatota bacterium]